MTPEQEIILRKLNEGLYPPTPPSLAKVAAETFEWKQRRCKHGLILWIKKIGGFQYADITFEDRQRVIRTSGAKPVKRLTEMYLDFDKTVTEDMVLRLSKMKSKMSKQERDAVIVYVERLEALIRRYQK